MENKTKIVTLQDITNEFGSLVYAQIQEIKKHPINSVSAEDLEVLRKSVETFKCLLEN